MRTIDNSEQKVGFEKAAFPTLLEHAVDVYTAKLFERRGWLQSSTQYRIDSCCFSKTQQACLHESEERRGSYF